ncbi:mapk phosphatase 2 [Pelomyxa schiedti]|nr:mapk phosphatase 2 [Pelomyxa schiedti]
MSRHPDDQARPDSSRDPGTPYDYYCDDETPRTEELRPQQQQQEQDQDRDQERYEEEPQLLAVHDCGRGGGNYEEEHGDGITTEMVMPQEFDAHFSYSEEWGCYVPARRARPDKIMSGLYLGDQENAYNSELLEELGITHVLSVAEIANMDDHLAMFDSHIQVATIQLLDQADANISAYFDQAIAFIRESINEGGTVLVHCVWGMSRSATFVIAYVMYTLAMDWLVALRCVQLERPIVFPNLGFARQLAQYDKQLKEKRAQQRLARMAYLEKSSRKLHKIKEQQRLIKVDHVTDDENTPRSQVISVDCSGL